jgi:hypothetical protein
MSWTECNGPPVSLRQRRGFGSTVIVSMAKQTVGGDVQLDYAPSGLAWRLTCTAANVLEQGNVSHKNSAPSTALTPVSSPVLQQSPAAGGALMTSICRTVANHRKSLLDSNRVKRHHCLSESAGRASSRRMRMASRPRTKGCERWCVPYED